MGIKKDPIDGGTNLVPYFWLNWGDIPWNLGII